MVVNANIKKPFDWLTEYPYNDWNWIADLSDEIEYSQLDDIARYLIEDVPKSYLTGRYRKMTKAELKAEYDKRFPNLLGEFLITLGEQLVNGEIELNIQVETIKADVPQNSIEKSSGFKHPQQSDDDVIVCEICGSTDIEHKVWHKINTSEYVCDSEEEKADNWCNNCENHAGFIKKAEFIQQMDSWWHQQTEGIKENLIHATSNIHTVRSCWEDLSFQQKRKVYRENSPEV